MRADLPSDLDQVAEPLGDHQRDLAAAPLDQRIGGDRRAVRQPRDRGKIDAVAGAELAQARDHRLGRIGRRRGHLVQDDAVVVSSNAKKSVKVPPTSTPIIQAISHPVASILQVAAAVDQSTLGCRYRLLCARCSFARQCRRRERNDAGSGSRSSASKTQRCSPGAGATSTTSACRRARCTPRCCARRIRTR